MKSWKQKENNMSEKEINFEKELNRLKEIVSLIQQKDLPLDESLKLYEEGSKIVKALQEELNRAEEKVEKIIDIDK